MKIALVRNGFYLTAEIGGGSDVSFRRPATLPPATWETFTVQGRALLCNDGVHYLTFDRNGDIRATATAANAWEHIVTGPIVSGAVSWQADDGGGTFIGSLVIVEADPPTLDDLGVTGLTFANGWQYRGATDFALLSRFLRGEDIGPVVDQRLAAGANILRVLTMAGNLFPLDPDTYSDDQLRAFVAFVNGKGARLELVALADCAQPLTKPLDWQRRHLQRVASIAGMKNLCELGNEINNFYQNVNPMDFTKPAGCLSSRGSITGYGEESKKLPAAPHAWDYSTIHGDRDDKWLQNIAKAGLDLVHGFTGYAGTQGPLVHNEPTKPPNPPADPGYPRTSAADWFIAGVQCSVWRGDGIGGGLFHCDAGLQSQRWNDEDLARATSFYRGMTAGQP